MLSVASQCPACSGALTQTFLGLEHEGELAECRSCGHPVRSRTAVCPHCGTPKPARRSTTARALTPLLAAVLLGALAITLRYQAFHHPRATAPGLTDAPHDSQPATALPAPAERDSPPVDLARAESADSASVRLDLLRTRWTADWSNMRRAPDNGAPIVRVLPPATEVRAAQSQWGWWAVIWKGDTVGYIAGALLRTTRPTLTR